MIKTAKIIEVINEWHMRQKRDAHGNTIWQTDDTEKLANALIVVGIGDVWSITEQAEKAIQAAARRVRALEDEYLAMREAMKYLIDTGGADTCARCAYDTKDENEPCGGLCVDGMVEWFKKNGEE